MTGLGATDYQTVEWFDDVTRLKYADYWNDETEERRKPFWVLNGDYRAMEAYLAGIGLLAQLRECVEMARDRFGRGVDGVGVDLGAGNLWAAPHLMKLGAVERLYCVEYSRHRLLQLGPALLTHYGVPVGRIVLALGDLHRLALPDATMDFVFMSAAFHHSDRPEVLLQEIRRVLKPSGVVLIIGEQIAMSGTTAWTRHMLKFCLSRLLPKSVQARLFGHVLAVEHFLAREEDLLSPDERLGDHMYTQERYLEMFTAAGFCAEPVWRQGWPYQAFVLGAAGA